MAFTVPMLHKINSFHSNFHLFRGTQIFFQIEIWIRYESMKIMFEGTFHNSLCIYQVYDNTQPIKQ